MCKSEIMLTKYKNLSLKLLSRIFTQEKPGLMGEFPLISIKSGFFLKPAAVTL